MVENCCIDINGEIITPDNPGYDEARLVFNRKIDKCPLSIVYCTDISDVANAVYWATENCVNIRIASGRHNYEGYCVGNDSLVIDVSRMNCIEIDQFNETVKIQAGVTNIQLYEFLSRFGYPFPGGTCPDVGLSGFTLGGGWGYSCRMFGLGCDSLIEAELVDYKGELLVANEYCNSELFWALRGAGGGNFGVVVSLTYKLPPKVLKVTYFEINYPNSTKRLMMEFMDTWQKVVSSDEIRFGMSAYIYNSAEVGRGIHSRGLFYGTVDDTEEFLQPFLMLYGAQPTLRYVRFIDAVNIIAQFYLDYETFATAGRFANKKFGVSEIENIISMIDDRAENSEYANIGLYSLGGSVGKVDRFSTAFYYRKADYIIALNTRWTDNCFTEENEEWLKSRYRYLKGITNGSYVNFPYAKINNSGKAYFGQNIYKLKRVKDSYDPLNFFSFEQSI